MLLQQSERSRRAGRAETMPGGAFQAAAGTLSRGLELLRFVNQMYPAHVAELTELTGLPKATVSRLLHTLCDAGYLVQHPHDRTFSPAGKLRLLSAGVALDEWIQDVAAPVIDRLSRSIQWPSDLATLEGRGMTIRYTTRTTAPLPISEAINVSGLSMLQSDFGRAFLAFASDEQRERILTALVRSERPNDAAAQDCLAVERMLEEVRRRGYATRGRPYEFARASTIAVAVVVDGQAVAAINVICRVRLIPPAEVPGRFLAPLRAAAGEIAAQLRHDGLLVHPRRYDPGATERAPARNQEGSNR
ncbi:MAG: helix-turn-helix domain-containing protein [Alphaproteobacteria bacterium]